MKREVVQDFLNLPGIAGLALMDGRSRPYFYGIDRSLNFQQKEALAQGIQQVIDTTPADFEFFQFQFSGRQVCIYRLDHGIILLVLTVESLTDATYAQVMEQLKLELQQDVANAIATFRLLAGNTTLSGQNYWKQGIDTVPTSVPTSVPIPTPAPTPASAQLITAPVPPFLTEPPPRSPSPPSSAPSSTPSPLAQPIVPASPAPPPVASLTDSESSVVLQEVLAAMNHLSQYATQYLGPMVVTNYWKTTRPPVNWLNLLQVERSAQITGPTQPAALTAEQHQWIRDWVVAFVNRCAKVIRDFPKTVKQTVLDDRQKFLLFSHSP